MLCFVRGQDAATLQGGEPFTERVKLQGRLGLAARAELAHLLQPSYSGVQASERIALSAAECAGDFSGHAGLQKTNRKQRRVATGEAAKDDHTRLNHIPGGVVGRRQASSPSPSKLKARVPSAMTSPSFEPKRLYTARIVAPIALATRRTESASKPPSAMSRSATSSRAAAVRSSYSLGLPILTVYHNGVMLQCNKTTWPSAMSAVVAAIEVGLVGTHNSSVSRKVSRMPTNPGYVAAEARIFGEYALSPTVQVLALAQPRLRVRAVEVGAGEPVVLLHGFGHCTAHWAPLVSRLSGTRNLMLDAPGHGATDAVNFNGVDLRAWYKEMLTGCLDALGLEKVHLIGHSQGAMQALWLALDAPDRVRSVVAIGTPAVAFGARLTPCASWRVPLSGRCSSGCRSPHPRIGISWRGPWGPPRCAPIRTSCVQRTGPPTARGSRRRSQAISGRCSAERTPNRAGTRSRTPSCSASTRRCSYSGASTTHDSSRSRRRKPGQRYCRTAASRSSRAITSPGSMTSTPAPVSLLPSIRASGRATKAPDAAAQHRRGYAFTVRHTSCLLHGQ